MDLTIRWCPGVHWLRIVAGRQVIHHHGARYRGLVVQHTWRIGPIGAGVLWLRKGPYFVGGDHG